MDQRTGTGPHQTEAVLEAQRGPECGSEGPRSEASGPQSDSEGSGLGSVVKNLDSGSGSQVDWAVFGSPHETQKPGSSLDPLWDESETLESHFGRSETPGESLRSLVQHLKQTNKQTNEGSTKSYIYQSKKKKKYNSCKFQAEEPKLSWLT